MLEAGVGPQGALVYHFLDSKLNKSQSQYISDFQRISLKLLASLRISSNIIFQCEVGLSCHFKQLSLCILPFWWSPFQRKSLIVVVLAFLWFAHKIIIFW